MFLNITSITLDQQSGPLVAGASVAQATKTLTATSASLTRVF